MARIRVGDNKSGKYGYINREGNISIDARFESAGEFSDSRATVKIDEKWGCIDKDGNLAIPAQFDSLTDFHEGIAMVEIDGRWGSIDKEGNYIVEPQYDDVSIFACAFSESLASVKIGSKYGYIDKEGNVIIEPQYDGTYPFSDGLALVNVGGKPAQYFGLTLSGGAEGGEWRYIDRTGKCVWKPEDTEDKTNEHRTEGEFDFRKAYWGMSETEVKAAESAEFFGDGDGYTAYKLTLAGLDSYLAYYFTQGKLTHARYVINEEHSNNNLYIDDFSSLKEILTKKYGYPDREDKLWKNDLFRDDTDKWGTAISIGHLVIYAKWETPLTERTLFLGGDNYEIDLRIEYQ